jgi:hypothetical protein
VSRHGSAGHTGPAAAAPAVAVAAGVAGADVGAAVAVDAGAAADVDAGAPAVEPAQPTSANTGTASSRARVEWEVRVVVIRRIYL